MQYWKPGEKRPGGGEGGGGPAGDGGGSGSDRVSDGQGRTDSKKRVDKSRRDEGGRGSTDKGNRRSSEGAKKRVRKGKGKERHSTGSGLGGIKGEVSRAASKPPVAGPSQGLLAMKFMQRKAQADEAQKQRQEKREKLESDFSSSYAKRLKADKDTGKDRRKVLICRRDEQDPALVVVGRRSFGGFNVVAEAAYDACIRDIEAGERLGRPGRGEDAGGDGISDTEMAERLGKNVRHAGQR
ncbi:unnamed protein product [Ectocarpus sp. CCAP 1310/34]|nr:unnamed protein product [Ectocarpus sp. CCAP 1310/34]